MSFRVFHTDTKLLLSIFPFKDRIGVDARHDRFEKMTIIFKGHFYEDCEFGVIFLDTRIFFSLILFFVIF